MDVSLSKQSKNKIKINVFHRRKKIHSVSVNFDLDLLLSYGFHAREGCKSLVVFRTGELLYYVAAVAVFYRRNDERGDEKGDTQRHYLGHTEDISW